MQLGCNKELFTPRGCEKTNVHNGLKTSDIQIDCAQESMVYVCFMNILQHTLLRIAVAAILLPFFSSSIQAQTEISGYWLEILDEPYETLSDATTLDTAQWDEQGGWDDPVFGMELGFDFTFFDGSFNTLVQPGESSIMLYGVESPYEIYDSPYTSVWMPLVELDLVDLGLTGIESLGLSTFRWKTTGEPGSQIFAFECLNAGVYDEVAEAEDLGLTDFTNVTFQLRLYEEDGSIELHFGNSNLSSNPFWTEYYASESYFFNLHAFLTIEAFENDYYDNDDDAIVTNSNTGYYYENVGEVWSELYSGSLAPFTGFPSEGRMFRYSPLVGGCHIETACNYDPAVTAPTPEDCIFPEEPGTDCDGNCLSDTAGDGVCDEVMGCTDGLACNYNPEATDDDDSCNFPDEGYGCDGECLVDTDGDGVCNPFEVAGCEDPEACNYAQAPTDIVPCVYPANYYSCDGLCINDEDEDGVCDELEQFGCTDPDACNFEWFATEDDGSCYDSLPLTLVGDTLVSVGDTLTIIVEGPVEEFNGEFNSGCAFDIEMIELSSTQFVGVVQEGFEGCTLTYLEWPYYGYYPCFSEPINIVLDTTSTHVMEGSFAFQMFPNPATTEVLVELPASMIVGGRIALFNALGQTVLTQRTASRLVTLDVSSIPNGVYNLQLGAVSRQLVIQR